MWLCAIVPMEALTTGLHTDAKARASPAPKLCSRPGVPPSGTLKARRAMAGPSDRYFAFALWAGDKGMV